MVNSKVVNSKGLRRLRNRFIIPRMWHIAFTHEFVEDFAGHYEALIPYYFRYTYRDWDRDVYHWYHWSLVPFVKAWRWWIFRRWWIEIRLIRIGILLHEDCADLSTCKMNWDWRWKDKG